MDELEFIAMLQAEEYGAVGFYNSEIASDQEKALRYYHGELFGNEEEGHSTVISRDVASTIDGIMPDLIRVFVSGDNVVEFQATKPGDEAVAEHPGKRDIERILNLYAPNAKLNVNIQDGIPVHGIVEDVVISERFLNITTEFFEREISRDTQRFRNMAQIISTYGISDAMENTNYTARGVTVFQMYYAGDRWWILSSLFERESGDVPLPPHLLD